MVKITLNLSKFLIKTLDASEKCIEFLKLIRKSAANKTSEINSNSQNLMSIEGEDSQDKKCMLCAFTYSNNQSIERHLQLKHQVKKQLLDTILQSKNPKRTIPTSMIKTYLNAGYKPFHNETKKYACKICPYKTSMFNFHDFLGKNG